jgi:hypothetical protein
MLTLFLKPCHWQQVKKNIKLVTPLLKSVSLGSYPKMRTFFFTLFFCALANAALSQPARPAIADSIKEALATKPSFNVRLNTRNAFVTGRPVRTYGIKAGYSYGQRITFGIGYHWLKHGDTYQYRYDNGVFEERELRLSYAGVFFEYTFQARKHWQITFPFVFGLGRSYEFATAGGRKSAFNHAGVVLYEPGVIAEYHFLRYFAVGAGVGMRLMLKNNQNIDQQFTAPLWEMRFRFKLGQVRRDVESLVKRKSD